MQFTVSQDTLVRPLQLVCSIVERRATLPILSNVLLRVQGDQLSMTSTDMELEMIATLPVSVEEEGKTTVGQAADTDGRQSSRPWRAASGNCSQATRPCG